MLVLDKYMQEIESVLDFSLTFSQRSAIARVLKQACNDYYNQGYSSAFYDRTDEIDQEQKDEDFDEENYD